MKDKFFAVLNRLKYINRWSLMKNSRYESLSEHTLDVCLIAHALITIGRVRLSMSYDENIIYNAMYHDCTEIITGDLPTPIKYLNKDIKKIYKNIENDAKNSLLELLPDDLKEEYKKGFDIPEQSRKIIRSADKISALIKCIEEEKSGSKEFLQAKVKIIEDIKDLNCAEADIFLSEFMGSYYLSLDQLQLI